jgi:hypothetical protein
MKPERAWRNLQDAVAADQLDEVLTDEKAHRPNYLKEIQSVVDMSDPEFLQAFIEFHLGKGHLSPHEHRRLDTIKRRFTGESRDTSGL